jgi:hypothetical protein
LSAAELAIGARVEGSSLPQVEDGLWKKHELVKTWCMRGTLHLLASGDLSTYIAALQTEEDRTNEWLRKRVQVSPEETARIIEAMDEALRGKVLSRKELANEVSRRVKLSKAANVALLSPWGILLRPAAYRGALAFGPSRGQMVTFTGPGALVGDHGGRGAEEAIKSLARKFLAAYGPAGPEEFAHWWGSPVARMRPLFASLLGELEKVEVEGFKGYMLRKDIDSVRVTENKPSANLLPSFDCYSKFYAPRSSFVPHRFRPRIFSKEAGWVFPALMIDGFAAGVWRLKKRARRVDIIIELFRRISLGERNLVEQAAYDIGKFLQVEASPTLKMP